MPGGCGTAAAPLGSQAIGVQLRNQLYAGIVDVPEYGVRNKRGDFDPLDSENVFFRARAVLSGRPPSAAPQLQGHPDFPLRKFIRCVVRAGPDGKLVEGPQRALRLLPSPPRVPRVHVTKAKLEGLFAAELSRLQPTPG